MLDEINNFLKDVPDLDWFIFKCGLPWINLDIKVPYKEMHKEAINLLPLFSEYRESNSSGWRSICLHGISNNHIYDYTYYEDYKNLNQNDVPYKWTEASKKCPNTVKFLKSSFFNATFFRVRFMALMPGGYILPHVDMPRKILAPINIALNNPKNCIFKIRGFDHVPFKPGKAFILDTSNEHIVYNDSKDIRIHMIVHINYPILRSNDKKKWSELLLRSWKKTNKA